MTSREHWTSQLPPEIVEALADRDDAFVEEIAQDYLAADPEDQAGMLAFVREHGPERCRQMRVQHEQGIPTADDLNTWLDP